MTDRHPTAHEDLLEAVILGDLDPNDARVHEQIDDCTVCRTRLEELRELEHACASITEEADELLLESSTSADAALEDRVLEGFRETMDAAGRESIAKPSTRRWIGAAAFIGLAAAALVFFFVGGFGNKPQQGEPGTDPVPPLLGGTALRCLQPSGGVDDYGTFRWELLENGESRSAGVTYEITIEDSITGEIVCSKRIPNRSEWTPDTDVLAGHRSIHWQVRVHAPSYLNAIDSASATLNE